MEFIALIGACGQLGTDIPKVWAFKNCPSYPRCRH